MHVLAVIHGADVRSGVFELALREAGHELDEWSLTWGPPPRPVDEYDALLVLGGSMHADQEEHHPWLREETLLLQRVLAAHQPVLGVCLGAQLLARAAHSPVFAAEKPEIGWLEVELTDEGLGDPVLGVVPSRFVAFQWHRYTYELPPGAVELARSPVCNQAFRLGEAAWGVQFHPEVTERQILAWLEDDEDPPPAENTIAAETAGRIDEWNELGRTLCLGFADAASRVLAAR